MEFFSILLDLFNFLPLVAFSLTNFWKFEDYPIGTKEVLSKRTSQPSRAIVHMRGTSTALFGLIVLSCLLRAYLHPENIVHAVEFSLQITIEYLTELQSYIRQQVNQSTPSNASKEDSKAVETDNNYDLAQYKHECPNHRYITRIIERSPLIIYIEQFLTQNEIQHLIELTEPFLKPSMVYAENGTYSVNDVRTSTSAYLKRRQTPVVECIERRFAQFEGDVDISCLEPLQVVKYTSDQQYAPHYDWFPESNLLKNGGQRVTTFFTYLQANCPMGETEFLGIRFNTSLHERFCDVLMCDEKSTEFGIRFRPLPGNSIFWYNMDEHGEVDYLTYHAGRPPGEKGYKIGLNTWTRLDAFITPLNKE